MREEERGKEKCYFCQARLSISMTLMFEEDTNITNTNRLSLSSPLAVLLHAVQLLHLIGNALHPRRHLLHAHTHTVCQ